MMTTKKLFFTFLFLIPVISFTQVLRVQKLNGPYGGTFRAVNWDKNGNMYVTSDGGIFASSDNGKTWTQVEHGYDTFELARGLFKSANGDIIYQEGNGIYTPKVDGSRKMIGSVSSGSIFGVDSNGKMYFTKFPDGIYVTSDSGKTFNLIRQSNRWGSDFLELKSKKIAYSHGANLELSTNGGNDWKTQQPVTSDPGIGWTLASDSKENIFLCTGKEILRTDNDGNTWTKFLSPVTYPWSIFINKKDEIFVSSQLKLYSSTDYGQSWNDTGVNDYALCFAEDQAGNMFVGTFHHLYRRDENKKEWYEFDSRISQARINSIIMRDNNLLIMTTKELYKSKDMGKTWDRIFTSEYGTSKFYDFKNKERIFAYIDSPINYSTDYGSTWTRINASFPYDAIVDYEITDKDEIYAAANRNTLNYSSDFGKTWTTLWKGEENFSFSDLSLDKNENLYFGYGKNLYKYDKTEKRISNIGYFEKGTRKILVSPWETVYVLATDGLYYKANEAGWNKLIENTGYGYASAFEINKQMQMVLFNGNEILISSDLGKNFERYSFNPYLKNPISFYSDDDGNYFVGTQEGGLYKANIPTRKVELPTRYSLAQNYPNPFNGQTYIEFTLPKQEQVRVSIYNVLGQEIETLVNESLPIGNYKFIWNSRNLASGIYLYRVQTSDFNETKKMVLMK